MNDSESEEEWSPKVPKRKKSADPKCIIHCSDSTDRLIKPKSIESWNALLEAAEIQSHSELMDIGYRTGKNEIGDVFYHRQCRNNFILRSRYLSSETKNAVSPDPVECSSERVSRHSILI